jgi:hypothetical protein
MCRPTDEITRFAYRRMAFRKSNTKQNILSCGQEQMKKHASAREHVKIVFKFSVRFFLPSSLDVAVVGVCWLPLIFDLTMINIQL